MTAWNRIVFTFEFVLAAAALAGLVYRRHVKVVAFFGVYLGVTAASDALVLLWPDRFFTWGFWLLRETLQAAAKLGLAFELTLRIFHSLPRAKFAIGVLQLVVVVGTLVAVISNGTAGSAFEAAPTLVPWLQYGAAFSLLVVLGGALWYFVPLYPMHRSVLTVLTIYLFASTFGLRALGQWGWGLRDLFNYASGVAFNVVLAYWTREAWRPYTADEAHAQVFRFLRPWMAERRP